MADLVCNSSVVKRPSGEITRNEEQFATANHSPSLSIDVSNWLFAIFAAFLLLVYNLMVKFFIFKYQEGNGNPFESHNVLVNTSIIAFCVAHMVLLIMLRQFLVSSPTRAFYKIMKTVFFFSVVLANISLLVIFISL